MTCPRCGSPDAHPWGGRNGERKRYKCKRCGRQYYEAAPFMMLDDIADTPRVGIKVEADELAALLAPRHVYTIPTLDFTGEELRIGIMTDTHIGSRYTDDAHIASAIAEFKRQDVSIFVHAGDVTEGMSGRDGHVYELTHIGYQRQRAAAIDLLEPLGDIPKYFISGNHDLWYLAKADIGADIVDDIASALPNSHYLGQHEGDISVNGTVIRLWHGEDAGSYAISYRLQKIVESFTGGEKPNLMICGHTHKSMYVFDRNIHVISAGCIQSQSKWMRGKRIAAHRGFWIARLILGDGEIRSISPTWYPIY